MGEAVEDDVLPADGSLPAGRRPVVPPDRRPSGGRTGAMGWRAGWAVPERAVTLVPSARTLSDWAKIVRRRPMPAVGFAVALAGFLLLCGVLPIGAGPVAVASGWVPGLLWQAARRRLLASDLPRALDSAVGRVSVDVRGAEPVPPTWRWASPAGRACGSIGGLAAAVTVGLLVGGVWAVATPGDGGWIVAGVALFLAFVSGAGAWMALGAVPRECRRVVAHGVPVEVSVQGIEHERQRWHVERVDGAGMVVLDAFRGRSRLVAGDVVHLWLAPEVKDPLERRVAVTGPFGTLWPSLPDKTEQTIGGR